MLDYTYEKAFITDEIKMICGVDEAGRGPLGCVCKTFIP